MTADEIEIIQFLQLNPDHYYSRKEISRKAKRRKDFDKDPHWATVPLASLLSSRQVVQNESGHFKMNTGEQKE